MPLRRSHKAALAAIGVIAGWISFSAISNQKAIRLLYCPADKDGVDEVICRSMRCEYKYYFFVPFSKFWYDKVDWYNPKAWCIRSVLDEMNK